ncbi:MAG: type II toxin-antitoxin system RelE/ParE family toxin [Nanoarchaeota archaeon]
MYSVSFGPQPEKFLKKAEKEVRERIWEEVDKLKINPFPQNVVRLKGKKHKAFRVRVGKYRIQYYVLNETNELLIFDVDKRERAYN